MVAHLNEMPLSPSEKAALKFSGAGRESLDKTRKALASIVLGFELIIVVLMGLAVFGLALLSPRELGLWLAGGLAFLAAASLAFMRVGKTGIVLGWMLHVCMLGVGFVLPLSLFVTLLFGALWVYCIVRGGQIDRERLRGLDAR